MRQGLARSNGSQLEEVGSRGGDVEQGADDEDPDRFHRVKGGRGVSGEFLYVLENGTIREKMVRGIAGPIMCEGLENGIDASGNKGVRGAVGWEPATLPIGDQVLGGGEAAGGIKGQRGVVT